MADGFRIERVITQGILQREGAGFHIENNVFLIGDDNDVIIIDAAHDAKLITEAVDDRNPLGILLTHGHEDHINAALELAERLDTHTYLHSADHFLWHEQHGSVKPDFSLTNDSVFEVAGVTLQTVHTPGHTPGSVSFVVSELGTVFSGDTLFHGGPGATRWEYSDFEQLVASIRTELFTLPDKTQVLPGHGQETTVAAEKINIQAFL